MNVSLFSAAFPSNQEEAPSPELLSNLFTEDFYIKAHLDLKKTKNYETTYRSLMYYYPKLRGVGFSFFKRACQDCFPYLADLEASSPSLLDTFRKSISNESTSNTYYYNSLLPLEKKRKGRWAQDEENHFIQILFQLANTEPDLFNAETESARWGYISHHVPGRTGKQCYDKYASLVAAQKIPDVFEIIPKKNVSPFTKFSSSALLPEIEDELVSYVNGLIQDKEHISTNMISFMAINLYYDPRNLAGIATNHYFWSKGIAPNPDSEEYKTHYDEILEIASNR